jgi:hypothetical protein
MDTTIQQILLSVMPIINVNIFTENANFLNIFFAILLPLLMLFRISVVLKE